MTGGRDKIDRLAKLDEAATRKLVEDLGDAAKSAEERLREAAQRTFDRIKAARGAHRKKGVKKTG